jgi:Fe-S oxidoreductase
MKFDPFVLPFTIGMIVLFTVLIVRYVSWVLLLSSGEKSTLRQNIFTFRTLSGIREIFFESLLHKKIYTKNRLLGYMHMSLAFGWFLLIVVGHFETSAYFGKAVMTPYVPIFVRFFQTDATHHTAQFGYWFIMDTILLFILSGVFLAWYKRRRAKKFGMKRTTQHVLGDRIALTVLWFIFPLRLVAESITSILYGGGSYLTFGLGSLMEGTIANYNTFYFFWWAYSISLGIFFVVLPFSRYMHIPTEVGLIMLRNWGLKSEKEKLGCVSQFEIHSCSSCGICLDSCQLTTELNSCYSQSPYVFKSLRNSNLTDSKLNDCLMCGRCEQTCVVGIPTNNIRQAIRNKKYLYIESNLDYLNNVKAQPIRKSNVIYFAGCMSHLTPGIKKAMDSIFKAASVNYSNLDQYESVCCGRPMMLAGMSEQAQPLINKNKELILRSGAKTLVTSCPICYKVFKEDYKLDIEVLHHTTYLQQLIDSGKLKLQKSNIKVAFHDPCELGRGSGIYEAPRQVIKEVATLVTNEHEKEQSLCCGGSLANTILTAKERNILANSVLQKIAPLNVRTVITACPLCKKTFANAQKEIEIKDIAEFVAQQLSHVKPAQGKKTKVQEELMVK